MNDVSHNMIVANFAADGGCLDNDDGSAWYLIHDNFCVFGGHKVGGVARRACSGVGSKVLIDQQQPATDCPPPPPERL